LSASDVTEGKANELNVLLFHVGYDIVFCIHVCYHPFTRHKAVTDRKALSSPVFLGE